MRYNITQLAGENLRDGGRSTALLLPRRRCVLGRASDCDVKVDLESVSAHHAVLEQAGEALEITDLGSKSGTFVNFARVKEPKRLNRGDLFSLGREALFLVGLAAEEEQPAGQPIGGATESDVPTREQPLVDLPLPSSQPPSVAAATVEPTIEQVYRMIKRLEPIRSRKALFNAALEGLAQLSGAEKLMVLLHERADVDREEGTVPYHRGFALTLAAARGVSGGDPQPTEALVARVLEVDAGIVTTAPGPAPGETLAVVGAPVRGRRGALGLVYGQRRLSLGEFREGDARLYGLIGCFLGSRLTLLDFEVQLREWRSACDRLSHVAYVALPNLAAQLDSDIARLEILAAQRDGFDPIELVRLVREECAQIRAGLGSYALWLRGEASAIGDEGGDPEALAHDASEDQSRTLRFPLEQHAGER